jgi:hypothetical protein
MKQSRRSFGLQLGVLGMGLGGAASAAEPPLPGEPQAPTADTLARIQAVLDQLRAQAAQEIGPVVPRPSEEAAYLLLLGLASRGAELRASDAERHTLGVAGERVRARILAIGAEVRLTLTETRIQDKSGSYTLHTARLLRREGERWVERGRGRTVEG